MRGFVSGTVFLVSRVFRTPVTVVVFLVQPGLQQVPFDAGAAVVDDVAAEGK
jgi:hypothetical protein